MSVTSLVSNVRFVSQLSPSRLHLSQHALSHAKQPVSAYMTWSHVFGVGPKTALSSTYLLTRVTDHLIFEWCLATCFKLFLFCSKYFIDVFILITLMFYMKPWRTDIFMMLNMSTQGHRLTFYLFKTYLCLPDVFKHFLHVEFVRVS